jgi:spermidine/putrescine transport system substrate-binding protein
MSGHRLTPEETRLFLRMKPHSRRAFMSAFGATAAGFTLAACGQGGGEEKAGKAAKGEAPAAFTVADSEGTEIKFLNWDTYIGETTLADFKTASGIDVQMDLFSNNDELMAKFAAGNPGYDLIMPSNEFVTRMAEAGMLEELDHSKIPNKANLLPEFQDVAFDPGRKYSMPYTWLVLGIGYRKSAMKDGATPASWKVLFDSDEYKGRISLLKESADLFRLVFKYMGKSINDYSPENLAQAEAMLIKQKPNIKVFHEDNGQDQLATREVDLTLEYNGDIAQLMKDDEDVGFAIPAEGTLINSDCMCIPKGAKHPNNAHALINFMLDGQVGAGIASYIQYGTPNAAAKALMDDAYKNNPAIFPPAAIMAKSEYGAFQGIETSQAYEAAMTRLLAA